MFFLRISVCSKIAVLTTTTTTRMKTRRRKVTRRTRNRPGRPSVVCAFAVTSARSSFVQTRRPHWSLICARTISSRLPVSWRRLASNQPSSRPCVHSYAMMVTTTIRLRFDGRWTACQRSLMSRWRHAPVPAVTLARCDPGLFIFIMPPECEGVMHWRPLSVCSSVRLFVPYLTPKSRMKGHIKLKIGNNEANDMGDHWPRLQVERS